MSTVRTKLVKQDRPRIRFAMGDPDLGDLVYNLLARQTGGDDVPVAFNAMGAAGVAGAPAGSNIVAREEAFGNLHFTRLTLASRSITMTDEAGVVAYGGTKLYDFPPGVIRIKGVSVNLTVTKSGAGINADFDGDWSIGTATASNNATLTGTEANIIASTSTTQAVAGVYSIAAAAMNSITALTDNSGGTANNTITAMADPADTPASADALRDDLVANFCLNVRNNIADLAAKINELITALTGSSSKSFDGTATAIDFYFNHLIDDADQDITGSGAAAYLLLTGTIDITWENLGDV